MKVYIDMGYSLRGVADVTSAERFLVLPSCQGGQGQASGLGAGSQDLCCSTPDTSRLG